MATDAQIHFRFHKEKEEEGEKHEEHRFFHLVAKNNMKAEQRQMHANRFQSSKNRQKKTSTRSADNLKKKKLIYK